MTFAVRPALLALPGALLLALPEAALSAERKFELTIYSPISIGEVTRQDDCSEVVAAGNRVNATCEGGNGSFAVEVTVRQLEEEDMTCVISLRNGEEEADVGHDAADYESEDTLERCQELIDVAPGGEMLGLLTYHVTRTAW